MTLSVAQFVLAIGVASLLGVLLGIGLMLKSFEYSILHVRSLRDSIRRTCDRADKLDADVEDV